MYHFVFIDLQGGIDRRCSRMMALQRLFVPALRDTRTPWVESCDHAQSCPINLLTRFSFRI